MEFANTKDTIIRFFQNPDKPLSRDEFDEFWNSMTPREKIELRWTDFTTGRYVPFEERERRYHG